MRHQSGDVPRGTAQKILLLVESSNFGRKSLDAVDVLSNSIKAYFSL